MLKNIKLCGLSIFILMLTSACSFSKSELSPVNNDSQDSTFSSCSGQVLDKIYFGTNIPDSKKIVSKEQWQTFLEQIVTARFPAGFTVLDANGQWRGGNLQIERESSHIVEVLHENSKEADQSIIEIVDEYKKQFQQEAVLVIREIVHACS